MSAQGLGSRAILGKFYERLAIETGQGWLSRVAMDVDSDQSSETHKWLGMVPALREWVGGRNPKGFRENGITIENKTFEATLEVLVDEIRRDKTGQVMVRINELAARAAAHPMSLISTLLLNGATGVCYDGQYFFSTTHAEGENSTNQSNSITFDISDGGGGGTTTYPTALTMQRAIMQAIAQILGFKDDQNEPMNELASQFIVMTAPSLMAPAMAAVSLPALDSGASGLIANQSKFGIDPVVNARLSSWTDKFVVMRTDAPTKPFINQIEEPVTVSALAEGSEYEHVNNRHQYGIKRIGNAGYGMWQHACLVTFAA